jgi:alpha-glucosidase
MMRRRDFVAAALAAPVGPALSRDLARLVSASPDPIRVTSPNGAIEFRLQHSDGAPLQFSVDFRARAVIEPSPISMLIDGVDLGQGAEARTVEAYEGNERYRWRGVHSEAVSRFKGARVTLRHASSGTDYVLDVRVFDDGVGFRCIVPGSGTRVPDEQTTFLLPAGSTVWYHDLRGHYEGVHSKKDIAQAQAG